MLRLCRNPLSRNFIIARFSSNNNTQPDLNTKQLVQKLVGRAEQYRRELKKHVVSSPKHRFINSSLNSIDQTLGIIQMKRRQLDDLFEAGQRPDLVSLEILSNGTTHIRPSVYIRTPFCTYIFNCPEGASRFLPTHRVRPQTVQDFFVTRGKWDCFGGIFGVLLAKESPDHITHLHGPSNLKYFLECVRPFVDSDTGSSGVKQPYKTEKRTSSDEKFEDNTMTVYYIPVFAMNLDSGDLSKTSDMAYLLELKEPNKRIDIVKILAKKVPKGPLIGRLKSGESITLEDGTIVNPEDVYADEAKDFCPNVLIVDCDHISKLESLITNGHLQKYTTGGQVKMNYMVHFTADSILKEAKYQSWMRSFSPECLHVIVNGNGEALPMIDGIYRQQSMLNEICPDLFPAIFMGDFRGTVTQTIVAPSTNVVYAKPLERYPMRVTKAMSVVDPPTISLVESELSERIEDEPSIPGAIEQFKKEVNTMDLSGSIYPCVVFLGTGSAISTKYRNVSGYLLQLNESTSVLVDCGEGIYGQLKTIYGPKKIDDIMVSLSAIFITHAHLDHIGGMKTIIQRRLEAFQNKGIEYKPLVLALNFNVRKMLIMYRTNFENLERYVQYVEIGLYIRQEEYSKYSCNELTKEITCLFPATYFSAEAWNLKKVTAVQVHHTRMANGFIFDTNDGKRIVFSGDTMPCNLLVEFGKGADLLIHEATFEDCFEEDARRKKHSTTGQAMDIAKKMGAKLTILSHFSARYPRVPNLNEIVANAGNVGVAFDNMVVPFNKHSIVPKLIPVLLKLFDRELKIAELKKL